MRTFKLFALSILMVLCLMATGAALGEEANDTAPALFDEVPDEMVEAEDEIVGEVPDDAAEVEAEDEVPDDTVEVDEGELTIESATDDAGAETYICRYCMKRYAKRDKTAPKADSNATDGATDGAADGTADSATDGTSDAATDSTAKTVVCKYCGRSFVVNSADDSASYTKGSRGKRSYKSVGSYNDNRPNMKGGSYSDNRATSGCNCNCNCQGATSGDNAQTRSSGRMSNRQKSMGVRPKG